MLKLTFDFTDNIVTDLNGYFDVLFDKSKIDLDFYKRVIKDIDKSTAYSINRISSPFLGDINSSLISGGSKVLLMIKYTDEIFPLEYLGNNCLPILKEICDTKDVIMYIQPIYELFKYGGFKEIFIIDSGKYVHNYIELYTEAVNLGYR